LCSAPLKRALKGMTALEEALKRYGYANSEGKLPQKVKPFN